MSDIRQQQQQLVNELIAGRIDQATYQRRLAQLQSGKALPAAAPPKPPAQRPPPRPQAARPKPARKAPPPAPVAPSPTPPRQQGLRYGSVLAGQYKIREQLGKGGMGEVWKAYDDVGDVKVVIKVLPSELQGSVEEMERVQQTFRHVHGLQHQHICPTHYLGNDASVGRFLVMKYIDGVTLRHFWKLVVEQQGHFPIRAVRTILTPVADALDYAHRQRVVHRDIKSENIMVSRNGHDPQIVDFGLAAEIRNSQARVSNVRMEKTGTYPYMSPEQWRGLNQDGRTDQYALGIVAYELLAGRLPFADRDRNTLRQRVLTEAVPSVPGLPPAVFQVLCQALAKDPSQRFQTCTQFVDALNSALTAQPADSAAAPPPLTGSGLQSVPSTAGEMGDTAVPVPLPVTGVPAPSESGTLPVPPPTAVESGAPPALSDPGTLADSGALPAIKPVPPRLKTQSPLYQLGRVVKSILSAVSKGVLLLVLGVGLLVIAIVVIVVLSKSGYDFSH